MECEDWGLETKMKMPHAEREAYVLITLRVMCRGFTLS